tara:strand:- start:673 stop:939 length:267 start_codon:yes stop_codon:yes gene_type:complete
MVYKKHIFICTKCKKDENGSPQGDVFLKEIKNQSNKQELKTKGYRLSSSGCICLCSKGINSVIYPEGKFIQELKLDQDSINKVLEELK